MFILNSLLCFFLNKCGKYSQKVLKTILSDFYSIEDVAAAKCQLMRDIDNLDLSVKRPYIPQRRDSEARLSRELDDLFALYVFLDEHRSINKLPKYVSDNPDAMPNTRLYEGDMLSLMNMLREIQDRQAVSRRWPPFAVTYASSRPDRMHLSQQVTRNQQLNFHRFPIHKTGHRYQPKRIPR